MNKRGFAHVRVGHAGAPHALHKRSSCATGGFYTNPTTGMTVSSANPVNISWDTSCLPNTSAVDIYLIAPGLASSRIHEWQDVNFALGSFQTTLEPRWWNDSSSMPLQLSIVASGSQPFLSPFPAGPVFTATYTAPTSGSTPADANPSTPNTVTYVNNFPTNSSLSKGKIAAGILVPLFFIAIGIYVYIRISRARGIENRRRFSEAVDKRMSTISSDWKSITPAGATAAIRNSIAVASTGNRSSAFTFGTIRPVSTMAVEGDSLSVEKQSIDISQMSQLRPGIRASAFGERVSRVSFAADVRPSMDSRRTTTTSRVFRTSRASSFIPPVPIPTIPIQNDNTGDMSPTQTKGALSLTPEDIKARMERDDAAESLSNMDEVWPSLSMMRTGDEEEVGDDYLLPQNQSVDLPMPPFPVHAAPTSPPIGMMTLPENMMSPDEMLRAYATRKIASPPTSPIAFPARTLSYNGSSMRTLYTPTAPTPTNSTPDSSSGVPVRVSVAQTIDAEKRYTSSYASVDPYAGFTG
ncbi:hypothetical protein J3R83DRAFT_9088 [Lanmaoa asiatica]|nr:hypothetical protein J3R83DRAFT_9088 [Lanmaoa asiatica]